MFRKIVLIHLVKIIFETKYQVFRLDLIFLCSQEWLWIPGPPLPLREYLETYVFWRYTVQSFVYARHALFRLSYTPASSFLRPLELFLCIILKLVEHLVLAFMSCCCDKLLRQKKLMGEKGFIFFSNNSRFLSTIMRNSTSQDLEISCHITSTAKSRQQWTKAHILVLNSPHFIYLRHRKWSYLPLSGVLLHQLS